MDDMVKRRNFNLIGTCAMCLEEEESVDHFFVHCHWVYSLWRLLRSLTRVSWI